MKRAFTLIEVNLAVLVMAGGILSVVILYSLGFREARQSHEDLASAAYADEVFSPIVAALSATDLLWSKFNAIQTTPSNGWGSFLDGNGNVQLNDDAVTAMQEFGARVTMPSQSECFSGLVICHETDSGVVKIGFRASKRKQTLLSAPLYYTEVRFQGKQQ